MWTVSRVADEGRNPAFLKQVHDILDVVVRSQLQ
jgi:hypothetical protein